MKILNKEIRGVTNKKLDDTKTLQYNSEDIAYDILSSSKL